MTDLHDDWWASLNHGGLLIAPAKIPAHFADAPPALSHARADRLRRDVVRMLDDDAYMGGFLDQVFESLLELPAPEWLKASDVGAEWSHAAVTGEAVRPRRVWRGPNGEVLPLFATDGKWGRGAPRIGVGKGRRAVSRVIEWLRNAHREIAVLTNGRQIRLIHAGADYDAFCEWDIELWFDEGAPGPQVTALRRLLGRPALLAPTTDARSPLLSAIHESRRGQGELSAVLGERVRQAVELLIRSSSSQLEPVVGEGNVTPNEAYIAATRIVMRLVVVLFAEARELLPRVDPIYHGSYGLQGLREELDREAGGKSERLRHRHAAWPRLLGLFRLVYRGSGHGDLQVPEYGGGLFQPGDPQSEDAISRALAAFESPKNVLTDDVVHRMLELLTRSRVRVRQGRGSTWVEAPVDFSDLSSEYIGILYEGLLDYELRRAPAGDPMVFLELGDQPALPLSRLDGMTAKERGELLKKLKTASKKSPPADEEESGEDEEAESEEELEAESEEIEVETSADEGEAPADEEPVRDDLARHYREMVDIWARNAVRDAGWTKRGADLFDDEVTKLAGSLIRRVVLPGEWFLVRWGGTRKGAGTFYTRPQLAGPTTRRTLQPLAYRAVKEVEDPETGLVDVEQWEPRTPEEILKLRVCDPAMGSGSFLVSALRFLTEALFESLHHHHRLEAKGEGTIARLADGVPADHPSCETLPVPTDHESFEDRLKARLKRHVVERCIYGVDADPVAVELARLALWIETMDRTLPFEFLDHKLKCGNSLVGCWFDRLKDYPIRAWDREGGDQKHDRFVHHFHEVVIDRGKRKGETERRGDPWTHAIKVRRAEVRAELAGVISSGSQPSFRFGDEGKDAQAVHAEAHEAFEKLHAIPIHDALERARFYAENLANNATLRSLRASFNLWCALWFWPGDEVALAPGPRSMHEPSEDARRIVSRLADQHRFFHWELEFPDVFHGATKGFDAMILNPPWETVHRQARQFFSNIDPLYPTYTKQAVVQVHNQIFSDARSEDDWIRYCARISDLSHWFANTSRSTSDLFSLQGKGRPYTFRLFSELGLRLLNPGGRWGAIVPSSIFSDKSSRSLREHLLTECNWEYLLDFENADQIFPIHRSSRFSVVVASRREATRAIRVSFMERDLDKLSQLLWSASATTPYLATLIYETAPQSLVISELTTANAVRSITLAYQNGRPFAGPSQEWPVTYGREFNMSDDADRFHVTSWFEERGYARGDFGFFVKDSNVALPFLEGRCIDQFHCFASRWISGRGRRARWEPQSLISSDTGAQFYILPEDFVDASQYRHGCKIAVMDVTGATNARSVIAACVPPFASGHSLNVANLSGRGAIETAALCAALNSYVFDALVRLRLVGQHVTQFFLADIPLPSRGAWEERVAPLVIRLNGTHPLFARWWIAAAREGDAELYQRSRSRVAVTTHERVRLRAMLDAIVAMRYGQGIDEMAWILEGCDRPTDQLRDSAIKRQLNPKGFWRIDRDRDPELRSTVLTLVALHDLLKLGLDDFLGLHDGQGWMLPETVRLSDYNLGHDDRAKQEQAVASALGPRFYDWQLAQDATASWEECERHAELLDRILPLPAATTPSNVAERPLAGKTDLFGNPVETDLFGRPVEKHKKRGRR